MTVRLIDRRYRQPGPLTYSMLFVATGVTVAAHAPATDGWMRWADAAIAAFLVVVGLGGTAGELAKPCPPVDISTGGEPRPIRPCTHQKDAGP